MDYPIHTYPRDLARQIASQWATTPDASDVLPPEEAIASLLSEAYQLHLGKSAAYALAYAFIGKRTFSLRK
jgi:hypothetical protein